MTIVRVVFDTNVLLSAVGWGGNPLRCLLLARAGVICGLTCAEIAEAFVIVGELREFLQILPITGALQGAALHSSDDKVIECALIGEATHIVTGDRKHLLPIRAFRGIQIVSPTELLEQVTST